MIDEDGGQLGILPIKEAIEMAKGKGLDVVEVSPNTEPPECKILDHGKYLFEQKKKSQGAKKKQKTIQVKEIKFRPFLVKEQKILMIGETRHFGGFHTILAKLDMSSFANHDCTLRRISLPHFPESI